MLYINVFFNDVTVQFHKAFWCLHLDCLVTTFALLTLISVICC